MKALFEAAARHSTFSGNGLQHCFDLYLLLHSFVKTGMQRATLAI